MTEKPWHGGNPPPTRNDVIDFSSNLHPAPPPESVLRAAEAGVARAAAYPDAAVQEIRKTLADRYGVPASQIFLTAGSSALLYLIVSVLRPKSVVLPVPCFSEYPYLASIAGARVTECASTAERDWQYTHPPDFSPGALGIMANPCNPTGRLADPECLDLWLRAAERSGGGLILDEAYADFVESGSVLRPADALGRGCAAILRSPAKFFGLPGLRIGVGFLSRELAERVERVLPPWPISSPACGALEAIMDLDAAFLRARARQIQTWTAAFRRALASVPGLKIFPTDAHYFLMRLVSSDWDGFRLAESLLDHGVWIRTRRGMPGLTDRDVRVSTRLPEENGRLVVALKSVTKAAGVSA
ncbi:histidinol-phosphate aminotransferase family protein [bacterium]|nr:histidinol-phosphate aminotransferase family protein [bacterium]